MDEFRSKICIGQVAADHRASHQTLGNPSYARQSIGASTAVSNGENLGQREIVEKLLDIAHEIKVTALGAVRAEAVSWTVDADEKDAVHKRGLRIEVAFKAAAKKPMKIPVR